MSTEYRESRKLVRMVAVLHVLLWSSIFICDIAVHIIVTGVKAVLQGVESILELPRLLVAVIKSLSMHAFKRSPSLPRVWDLMQYLLSPKAREKLFTPSHDELLADYYLSYAKYRSKWPRRFLRFCFILRTVVLLIDCWRVSGAVKLVSLVAKCIPTPVKRWWLG